MQHSNTGNIAETVFRFAEERGDQTALVIPREWDDQGVLSDDRITFREFATRTRRYMAGLRAQGLQPGDRAVVLFPLCIDLYVCIAALYACGITAGLIDPGMGAKRIKWSLQTVQARAILSVNAFLKYRWLLRPLCRIPMKFSQDKCGFGVRPFSPLLGDPEESGDLITRASDDEALITFTSGSTGKPKGANRTHGHLKSQQRALMSTFPPFEGQIDMTCLPVVAFHNLSCGVTTIMPAVDIANPASVEPRAVVSQIREWGVASLTSAPAFMQKLTGFLVASNESIPGMKLVGVGGAPVSKELAATMLQAFPEAKGFAVYGSTEAEPMAHAHLEDVVRKTSDGFLGGEVAEVAELALVTLPTRSPTLDAQGLAPYRVPEGGIGEVLVRGPHVNRGYINNPEANLENKVIEEDGSVWHRTGDLGYFDQDDHLWLVGRVKDRVSHGEGFVDPYPVESALEAQAQISRAAVMACSKSPFAIIVLQADEESSHASLASACEVLTQRGLTDVQCVTIEKLPVDGRHNSKVDRPTLRAMLDKQWPLRNDRLR